MLNECKESRRQSNGCLDVVDGELTKGLLEPIKHVVVQILENGRLSKLDIGILLTPKFLNWQVV